MFECDLVENLVPFIYSCNVDNDYQVAIPVSNIQNVLFEINFDDKIFVVQPVNNTEVE